MIAPKLSDASTELVVSDRPAAAVETVMRKITECVKRADDSSSRFGRASGGLLSSSGKEIDPTEKNGRNKPTVDMRKVSFDRRNCLVNRGLSARQ